MTGAYVRIKRGDRWQNVEFDQLTDAEMEQYRNRATVGRTPYQASEEGWKWALFLARWIRDHVKEGPAAEGEGETTPPD